MQETRAAGRRQSGLPMLSMPRSFSVLPGQAKGGPCQRSAEGLRWPSSACTRDSSSRLKLGIPCRKPPIERDPAMNRSLRTRLPSWVVGAGPGAFGKSKMRLLVGGAVEYKREGARKRWRIVGNGQWSVASGQWPVGREGWGGRRRIGVWASTMADFLGEDLLVRCAGSRVDCPHPQPLS